VAASVFASGIPGLFVPLASPATAALAGTAARAPALPAAPTPPGVLTEAGVRTVIARVAAALPAAWTTSGSSGGGGSASSAAAEPTISPASCLPLANLEYLGDFLPPPLVSATGDYQVLSGFIVGSETLTVQVSSFARPVPAVVFTAAGDAAGACPQYTETGDGLTAVWTVRPVPVRGLTVRAWAVNTAAVVKAKGVTLSQSATTLIIGVGHNLVFIEQDTGLYGPLAPADDTVIDEAVTAVTGARHASVG
jgi:hypothetical protein